MHNIKKLLSTFSLLFLLLAGPALAAGDHAEAQSGMSFRIGGLHLAITIQPEYFSPGVDPEVVVTVTDHQTGAAILDADLLARFGAPAAGHDMTTMAADNIPAQPNKVAITPAGSTAPHDMAAMAAPETGGPAGSEEEGGLDFGLPEPVAASVDLSDFKPLTARPKAGEFGAVHPVSRPGPLSLTLAVRALNGNAFPSPILFESAIDYQPPSQAHIYRTLFAVGLLALTLLAFLLGLALMKRAPVAGLGANLLDIPWIGRFVRSACYQPLFQIPTLIGFAGIIYLGLTDIQAGDQNAATLLTWTIWWAGIIFTFVLVGRVWCMMCPFGAVQDWLGRRFSLCRSFPRSLRNIWLSTALFLALTWWDSYSGIVNNPRMTAWLMIIFMVTSLATALVYKYRTFCRYICPIGGLIGLYSMVSPVELRSRSLEVCRKDPDKGCIRGNDRSHGCPMFETPMTLSRNNYCNLCAECVKGCLRDNIVLRFRAFGRDLWGTARGYRDEAYLAMVLVGLTVLVTAEMIEPWHLFMDFLIKALPLASLGISSHGGQEKAVFTLLLIVGALVVPALLLYLTSVLVRKNMGDGPTTGEIFNRFAYIFIPVGLSMHLAHNVSHLLREGVEIVPVLQGTYRRLLGQTTGDGLWQAVPLIGLEAQFWLQVLIIVALNGLSLYSAYRISKADFGDRFWRAFIPMAVLAVGFMLVNVAILGQPMALRHSH